MPKTNFEAKRKTCQTCARKYNPEITSSPIRYCSQECYSFGGRAYNKAPVEDKVKLFAIKLIDRVHWLQHNNDDRFDCNWDPCVEAKSLGL